MNVVVCVEQDLDTRVPVQVSSDGSVRQAEPEPISSLNAGDRAALELAMRLKENGIVRKVTTLTLAPVNDDSALRVCLARGADEAIHICQEGPSRLNGFATATALSQAIRTLSSDLVLCGHNSPASQVGPILAELLDLPQITGVVQFELEAELGSVEAQRRLERGDREKLVCSLPALLAIDPSAQSLRYISVRARLAALQKDVRQIPLSSLISGDEAPEDLARTEVIRVAPPRPRPKKGLNVDISVSAEERIRQIVSGGIEGKRSGLWEGDSEELADQLARFLVKRGFLPRESN